MRRVQFDFRLYTITFWVDRNPRDQGMNHANGGQPQVSIIQRCLEFGELGCNQRGQLSGGEGG
ncbi:hypothetical protein [Croceicoccus marinus]|uniref:Uncharacterized protein n=1 Tax=Croceicoccus marinus TaxID=450378 RepID=A0A1Z1F9G5_9SPHN|nr:hypothetical protein [Croceicoccus marinus]ARU15395.1 hypothetical protein A9D14_03410 [Croceicoccus marinus]